VGSTNVHIEFRRTGGLAGLAMVATVDTDTLGPEKSAGLLANLERADVADLASRPLPTPTGADRFQYDLTVQQGDDRHSLTVGESALPAELRPLVRDLMALAHPG